MEKINTDYKRRTWKMKAKLSMMCWSWRSFFKALFSYPADCLRRSCRLQLSAHLRWIAVGAKCNLSNLRNFNHSTNRLTGVRCVRRWCLHKIFSYMYYDFAHMSQRCMPQAVPAATSQVWRRHMRTGGVFHLQKISEIFHWEFPFGKSAFHLSQVPFQAREPRKAPPLKRPRKAWNWW